MAAEAGAGSSGRTLMLFPLDRCRAPEAATCWMLAPVSARAADYVIVIENAFSTVD
jgi:hypothetical protein